MSTTTEKPENVVCKHCGSNAVVKFGTYEGVQRYWCKVCKRKFRANDHLFQMKTPYYQVSSAIDDYYKGDSINEIRDSLNTNFRNYPSSKSVYGWIVKYTDEAIRQFKDYHPKTGSVWIADETVLKLDGVNYWCIDIIDRDTRFLLATKLSRNRETKDIQTLMEKAKERANSVPQKILTDGWKGYLDGIELAFGADSKHIVTDPFDKEGTGENTELIERWHGTLKDRTKSLRGLKSVETGDKFLDGFLAWYNFMRPHESLDGKTPAEKAGIRYTVKSWADVVRTSNPKIQVLTTPAKVDILNERKQVFRPITHRHYDIERKNKLRTIHRASVRRIIPKAPRISPKPPKIVKQHYSKRGGGLTRRGDI
jgi:putative transposase